MTSKDLTISKVFQLLDGLGIHFSNRDYVMEAFTHSTYSNEKNLSRNNERLEFLGDSVLNMVVSEELYRMFPDSSEDGLSRMKSYLVSNHVLANVCREMGLNEFLMLGKGENKQNGSKNKRNLACLYEAVLGALYLDQGLEQARHMVVDYIIVPHLQESQNIYQGNCKGALQEICARRFNRLPRYKLLEKSGEEHNPFFKVQVLVNDEIFGFGYGPSLKKAHNEAAYFALQKINQEEERIKSP